MSRVKVPPFTKVSRTGSKLMLEVTSDSPETKPSTWTRFWGLFSRELAQSNIRSLVLSGDSEGLASLIKNHRSDSKDIDRIDTALWNLLNVKGYTPSPNERMIINTARDNIRRIREGGMR